MGDEIDETKQISEEEVKSEDLLEEDKDENQVFQYDIVEPVFNLKKIYPEFRKKVEKLKLTDFPFYDDFYTPRIKKNLIQLMAQDPKTCILSPPPILCEFSKQFVKALDTCNAWEGLSHYPPYISNISPEAETAILIMIDLIHTISNASTARNWLTFISIYCVPEKMRTNLNFTSSFLKACCVCKRKRKVFNDDTDFWAVLDINNRFRLWSIGDEKLELNKDIVIDDVKLSRSGKTVKMFKKGELVKRIIPNNPAINQLWLAAMFGEQSKPKIVNFLSPFSTPTPDIVLNALYELMMNDAYVCVRTLSNFKVVSISKGASLSEALFDIFAYSGKVHELIMLLVNDEFSKPNLMFNTVLRGNSHLTNLFKVFFTRFGKDYYFKFLINVIKYIDSFGNLNIKNPDPADIPKIQKVVFSVLESIAGSLEYVPKEIRHFASVLKVCVSQRFNAKQSTFNTLSGFFYLRFLSPILSNPSEVDHDLKLENPWTEVLIPFAQFLMNAFNQAPVDGKYSMYESFNEPLNKIIYPKLRALAFSIADSKEVYYEPPTAERFKESLETVLEYIGDAGKLFTNMYAEISNNSTLSSPVGCNIAHFIASFFEQDLTV